MRPPLKTPIADRIGIARALLETSDDKLEHFTKVIKHRCEPELHYIIQTGKIPTGSQLHCILSMVSINMRLDSGSLESLNSMIKSSMSLANNTRMSLELLSSRVNSRKTCTLMTNGSTKLKDVKPVMESLAASAMLHQGSDKTILEDAFRWTPPAPVRDMVANQPILYDPGSQHSDSEKWAFKFHRKLMGCLNDAKKRVDNTQILQCIGLSYEGTPNDDLRVFLVAELTGLTCQLLPLQTSAGYTTCTDAIGEVIFIPKSIQFKNSVETLASLQQRLKEHKNSKVIVSLLSVSLHGLGVENGDLPSVKITSATDLFRISFRKPYEKKSLNTHETMEGDDNGGDGDNDGMYALEDEDGDDDGDDDDVDGNDPDSREVQRQLDKHEAALFLGHP